MRPSSRLLAGLASLAAWALAAGAAQARPPIWSLGDADSQMVLFGSLHVLPPGGDWLSPELSRALAEADDIWFELPVDPAAEGEAAVLAISRGMLPAGQTLSSLMTPSDAARLGRVAEKYGVPLPFLDRMQPWMAEVVLGGAAFRAAGATAEAGVEKSLYAAAPKAAAKRNFETAAEQIDIFASVPRPEQIAALNETLEGMEERPDEFLRLVSAWMAGDVARLEREALDPLREATPGVYRRLVVERNDRWMETLRTRLAGKGRTVVVVGVGHLVGPDGLARRFQALGYSVKGP